MGRLARLGVALACSALGLAAASAPAFAASTVTPLVSNTTTESSSSGNIVAGDTFTVTFSATPVLASSYSLQLTDGTDVGTLSNTGAHPDLTASVSGTTVTFTVTDTPVMSSGAGLSLSKTLEVLAASGISDGSGNPWNLIASGRVDKAYVLKSSDQVVVTYNEPVTVGPTYSLTLSEGTSSAVIDNTNTTVSGSGTNTLTFTLTADPTMTSGSALATDGPTVTSETGIVATPTVPPSPAPTITATTVTVNPATVCTDGVVTRVFGGTNCSIGFGSNSGPTSPDVFDVIALPTVDLPGPPVDNAPEVITNCATGSTDVAYDVNTGAELGTNPCGQNVPDPTKVCRPTCNTNSPQLDYIPTPKLASYEEVGVVETLPGSEYVSATAVPPQISSIAVSGNQATITYYHPVVCQNTSSDAATISQFTYETPYTDTNRSADSSGSGLVYPIAISCPSGTSNTIVVTYQNTIPFSSGLRFKFEGFGPGHFIVGAPGTPFAYEREASQSAYVGPGAAITAFTPQSTTTASSAGGNVTVNFTTTAAQTCTLSAISLPASAAALTLPSAASCNGSGTITVPANTSTTTAAVYTVTLSATGVPGTPTTTAAITITVPAAPVKPPVLAPVNQSLPTISGTVREGQTLLESNGSWSGTPTSYSYQWERCTSAGTGCAPIAGANAQTYTLTSADVGDRLLVLETASNIAGPGSPASSSVTAVVTATSTPGRVGRPNTRLLSAKIKGRSATFHMKAVGKATYFQCALVRKRAGKHSKPVYAKCSATKRYKHLRAGTYTFYVRAVGPGGADKTPATRTFKIA